MLDLPTDRHGSIQERTEKYNNNYINKINYINNNNYFVKFLSMQTSIGISMSILFLYCPWLILFYIVNNIYIYLVNSMFL